MPMTNLEFATSFSKSCTGPDDMVVPYKMQRGCKQLSERSQLVWSCGVDGGKRLCFSSRNRGIPDGPAIVVSTGLIQLFVTASPQMKGQLASVRESQLMLHTQLRVIGKIQNPPRLIHFLGNHVTSRGWTVINELSIIKFGYPPPQPCCFPLITQSKQRRL